MSYFVNYCKLEEQLNDLGSYYQLVMNKCFERTYHISY